MAYQSWSVVFGEQPSAAKWNILGTNDASFNDGTGLTALNYSTLSTISNPYKFSVYRNAAWTSGSPAKIVFDTEEYDTNNNFATGTYTVPVNGFYLFSGTAGYTFGGSGNVYNVAVYKNGSSAKTGDQQLSTAAQTALTGVSTLLQCTAADTIELYGFGNGAAGVTGATNTWFNGILISRT